MAIGCDCLGNHFQFFSSLILRFRDNHAIITGDKARVEPMATQHKILWMVTDLRGLDITLTDDVWQAIVSKHRELLPYSDAVRLTAQDPDEIYLDPESTARRTTGAKIYWYYKSQLFTGKLADKYTVVLVKVISEIGGNQGYVQSAWASSRIQPRLVLEWKR
jgi:hypothetical protein